MGRLIYSAIASLDGYVEDRDGRFDWGEPDEDVFRHINDQERPIGTYLYGRRMYETMVSWENLQLTPDMPAVIGDFTALWREAEKIVYSRTLGAVSSDRTRIERNFDVQAVRSLKSASERDLTVGGAGLAGEAIRAGLVDELQLYAIPVIVGGGKPWLPDGVCLELTLLDTRRFAGGTVYLRYRPRS